ncbi:hypothetical protein CC1G_10635 [Coprinopsis cinerea okayama7|uniref:Phospholipid binding protein n=1 Tax=Coprinopsis cinerea (strain Okayama-7 / 130 / ATCC MYA-4618 / FGSC 9003) TaxID=240176 RepID=A8P631_COPC7|nr:hypothetical protein CC1G_10635 [Coprinopsis cinerea okayama7\|eukprot:XP_001839070.2 hypothetical protein CC1G_10635 [Coprinopsis cinerea okayama7\
MAPEYVYALHDFIPENEDEVEFRAGERIEVGRNLAGKVGLFPQSYTTPAPPTTNGASDDSSASNTPGPTSSAITSTVLQPLQEESESESPISKPSDIVSPVPRQPPASFLNGHESDADSLAEPRTGGDGEMMKATMTDVQKAIEQLGRNRVDPDGGRSFSFASTRDGGETDTDFDLSDMDGHDTTEGEDWHKGARRKLAEKARQAVEDAERLEAMMASERSTAPPIDVELSDESEDEGDVDFTTRSTNFTRTHPHIPEEDEEDATEPKVDHKEEPSAQTITAPQKEEHEPSTATQITFTPPPQPPQVEKTLSVPSMEEQTPTPSESKRSSAPTPISQPLSSLPSPAASAHASGFHVTPPFQDTSSTSVSGQSVSTNPTSPQESTSASEKKDKKPPNEWTLDEVVEWLKSKGFDQDVCDKFIEQEITGDVLLELDTNLLKTEIGIMAFGKRVRIANAISDLRRPASINSFEPSIDSSISQATSAPSAILHHHLQQQQSHAHIQHSFSMGAAVVGAGAQAHVRSHSHGHSVHSYPGTPQGSLPSPIGYGPNGGISGLPMSAPSDSLAYSHHPQGAVANAIAASGAVAGMGVGLGIDGMGPDAGDKQKGRPAHLMLSPSDGNLKSKVIIDTSARSNEDEDRAHMSDGEAVAPSNSVRRRLFGRSQDSSLSVSHSSRNSKDGHVSPAPSPSQNEKDKESTTSSTTASTRHKSKKSLDKTDSNRLSIFGNTFGGTLGKGRKPPPSEDTIADSKSSSVFSRLHSTSVRKSSSNRPSTPSGSPKATTSDTAKDSSTGKNRSVSAMTTTSSFSVIPDLRKKQSFDHHHHEKRTSGERTSHERERAMLRKRTISGPSGGGQNGSGSASGGAGGSGDRDPGASDPTGDIKQGLSILEQVGEPDHTGWMRKKGVRYNSWKLRYCVLKGEHLYILRNNSKSETRLKGYVNIHGYKVTVDENLGPGRYGFRIDHDQDKTHYFSSDEKGVIREWMKAIMKATIGRDYTKPVVSSCNIPTIPLVVAQAMNPAPRPPSPTARDATQKALRRENPHQLSSRDARVLMGLPGTGEDRKNVHSFFADDSAAGNGNASSANGGLSPVTTPRAANAPPRPSRELRRGNSIRSTMTSADENLIDWANSHLPTSLQVYDPTGPLFTGLALLRIAESIKGKPASPPVPDSAFPSDPSDDKLDGLFKLFDFLLDNDVKMGSVSINDVRQGKRDKVLQLVKALKAWEDKRRALAMSVGSSVQAGSFMAPVGMQYSGTY